MTTGFVGADVQDLRQLATELSTSSTSLTAIEGRLLSLVVSSNWQGPDASRFRDDWNRVHRVSLRQASSLLGAQALDLRKQASEQETASAAGGGVASGTVNASVPPRLSPEQALADYASGKKTPLETAKWWSSLSASEQQKLITEHPELVGNLEGASYTDRSEANTIVLDEQLAAAKKAGNKDLVEYLQNVKKALGTSSMPPYQLISLETGFPPRAAISIGNLDSAAYASYLVPGMASNTASTVTDLTTAARAAYDEERRLARAGGLSSDIAVVAWMNYDSPEASASWTPWANESVFHGDLARSGGATLQKALLGYDAVLKTQGSGSSYLTVDAHSYGSTTTANALDGMPSGVVDSVVSMGSAGIENSLKDSYGSNIPNDRVYAIQGGELGDIAAVGKAGSGRADPYSLSQVDNLSSDFSFSGGSIHTPTNVHDLQNGMTGLVGYLDKGSTSLYNVALVNLGQADYAAR